MSRIIRSSDIGGALRSRQRGFFLNPFRFGGGGGGGSFTEEASDDFSGTLGNFTATNATNAGSTSISSGVAISSAALALATSGGGASNVWSGAGSFSDTQQAGGSIIITWLTADYYSGFLVQGQTGTGASRSNYGGVVLADASGAKTTALFKVISGTYTSLATASVSWNNTGDTMLVRYDSTAETLTMLRNGSAISGLTSVAVGGTALTGGKPGFIVSSGASTTVAVDNWVGYTFA